VLKDASRTSVKVNLPTEANADADRPAARWLATLVGPLLAGAKRAATATGTASLPSSITCSMPIRGADDTDRSGHRKPANNNRDLPPASLDMRLI